MFESFNDIFIDQGPKRSFVSDREQRVVIDPNIFDLVVGVET